MASEPERYAQSADQRAAASRGVAATVAAFVIWGLFPLYLKPITHVPATEVLGHRIGWCLLFVFAWLAWKGRIGEVRAALSDRPVFLRLVGSSALISVNWGFYVWAVSNERVLEASLGYFIGPLVNVMLGVVLLGERLSPRQWLSVGFAAAGVAWMTAAAGGLPWVSLLLAVSFAVYGMMRKTVAVGAVPGLAVETMLLAPFAVTWLLWLERQGVGAFGHDLPEVNALLVGTGLITALPLALFSTGARLIPYSMVGIIQYIGPTLQLLLGVFLYHEPFAGPRAIGFVLIWCGIAIFVGDNLRASRRGLPPP